MSDTDQCARCGDDCPMTSCPECGGCENTGTQPCQPDASTREMPDCEICADPEVCDCLDPDECSACYGTGQYVPEHCCLCGGSPYCNCCRTCGECVGTCSCPVTVQLADGGTLTLGGAT